MAVNNDHNPHCGTARNVLAMLIASGEQPVIVKEDKQQVNFVGKKD